MPFRPYLTAALLGAASVCCVAQAPGDTEYAFSSNAGDQILRATYTDSMTARRPNYTLYGDGRLVCDLVGQGGDSMLQTEHRLDRKEIEVLAEKIVTNGLMEYESRSVETQLRERHKTGFRHNPDLSNFVLEIDLEHYEGADGQRPKHKLIRMHSPSYQAKQFADVTEIRALAEIETFFHKYYCKAGQR